MPRHARPLQPAVKRRVINRMDSQLDRSSSEVAYLAVRRRRIQRTLHGNHTQCDSGTVDENKGKRDAGCNHNGSEPNELAMPRAHEA